MGDDFNMVLSIYEKLGEHFSRVFAEKFRKALDRFDLLDLPLMGGKWTWSN